MSRAQQVKEENVPISAAGKVLVWAFALSLAACFAGLNGMRGVWPPEDFPEWTLAWVLGALAIVLALRASRAAEEDRVVRRRAFVTMGLASLGYLTACYWRYGTWHDMAWIPFGAWVIGMTVAPLFCRQWLWSILAPLVAIAWVGPGLRGAITPSLSVLRRGDLSLKVSMRPRGETSQSIILDLNRESGRQLDEKFDLGNVTVSGSAGPLLDVRCWPCSPYPFDEAKERKSSEMLYATTFVPQWVRSWDVRVVIPMWPEHSAGHLRLPVPKGEVAASPIRDDKCVEGMELDELNWSKSQNRWPEVDCLTVRVKSSVFKPGLDQDTFRALRFVDGQGKVIDFSVRDFGADFVRVELDPLPAGSTWLDVDLYTVAQRNASDLIFDIPRFSAK